MEASRAATGMLEVLAIGGTVHHQVPGFRVDQFAEVLKNLCHLVSTLATADVDDDICVRPLSVWCCVMVFPVPNPPGTAACLLWQ